MKTDESRLTGGEGESSRLDDLLASYDYELPAELIASRPPEERDGGRLLVLPRAGGVVTHRVIRDLPELLAPGDIFVLNDSRVLKARLVGHRDETGGRWEGLFLGSDAAGRWRLMSKTKGKLRPGETVSVVADAETLSLELVAKTDDGVWTATPDDPAPAADVLDRFGLTPLPPYIRDGVPDDADVGRYQTVFASEPGSVAAPTAGLHFTDELLGRCEAAGIKTTRVTLHVGVGTFKPISAADISEHRMHVERYSLSEEAAESITAAKAAGGRVVAVGTTATRVLESAWDDGAGHLRPVRDGETDLFLRPGRGPRFVDGLVTNFHLPKSSLIVLAAAFAGRERVLAAYREAIAERYRFYSYGDASLIL